MDVFGDVGYMHWSLHEIVENNKVDSFLEMSRDDTGIEDVHLHPYLYVGDEGNYDIWDKMGQAVGKLQALKRFHIYTHFTEFEDDDSDYHQTSVPADWKILTRILTHVRQNITLKVYDVPDWDEGDVEAFAGAIHGHPTITHFDDGNTFPYESTDVLYAALATLPALESIRLANGKDDELILANPESLTELLRVPSLRSVEFHGFRFSPTLCQATANAFIQGTAITKIEFKACSFSSQDSAAVMADGLGRNTSVISIKDESNDEAFCSAIAGALSSNSTLQDLTVIMHGGGFSFFATESLSSVFLALGKNTALKTLLIGGFGWMDEQLSTAIKDGLGMNTSLESLELSNAPLYADNATIWREALSFLRTNKALKSLRIDVQEERPTESCVSAVCLGIASMLEDNTSLESLYITSSNSRTNADVYLAFAAALEQNTTLKTLCFRPAYGSLGISDNAAKELVSTLKKNYKLESFPDTDFDFRIGDVHAILRLNGAGRLYLIQDGSSIPKGVDVLSSVSNDINCVFLHLLENPALCNRSAAEAPSDSGDYERLTSPANPNGKREQTSVDNGKESRRRLT